MLLCLIDDKSPLFGDVVEEFNKNKNLPSHQVISMWPLIFAVSITLLMLLFFIILLHAYFKMLRLLNTQADLQSVNPNLDFPVRLYNLILNGAGTTTQHLSLFLQKYDGITNDAEKLADDERNGMVTYILIQGHPYSISFSHQSKYFMVFKIANECRTFPFPECATREPIESITTSVIHTLGYKPL